LKSREAEADYSTDRELVRAVTEGDRRAAEIFVVRFTRYVHSILHRDFELSKEIAEDLYQEVFVRLWDDNYRRLRNWRGEGDFAGYLGPIVRNLALEHFRRAGRDPLPDRDSPEAREDPMDLEPTPEEQAAVDERRRAIERAVEGLDERKRELYRRRFVEGQKHREIAEAMGMKVRHVGVKLLRLERELARLVGERNKNTKLSGKEPAAVRSGPPGASSE
jgi:RNA polymerase sigma-70 factor (ECF subfamily)